MGIRNYLKEVSIYKFGKSIFPGTLDKSILLKITPTIFWHAWWDTISSLLKNLCQQSFGTLGGNHFSGITRLRSRKDISDVGDSTNNPPVSTTGDDTEQYNNLVPLEQTQSLSGATTSFDRQEIEVIDTTATTTEGSNARTIFADGMKEASTSLALISATL